QCRHRTAVTKPKTLTKQQIVRAIGRQTRLRDADVSAVIERLIELMTAQLAVGGRIEIQNFLTLEVHTRTRQPSRQTRHPPGLLPVTYRCLKVRPGKKLRASLKDTASGGEGV